MFLTRWMPLLMKYIGCLLHGYIYTFTSFRAENEFPQTKFQQIELWIKICLEIKSIHTVIYTIH